MSAVRQCQDHRRGNGPRTVFGFGENRIEMWSPTGNDRLRVESLGPWMEMPKDGDRFFWATCDTRTGEWRVVEDSFKWPIDRLFYWQGLVHPTRESAEEWITRYGAAWLEGGGS